jgi:hypothetical protein
MRRRKNLGFVPSLMTVLGLLILTTSGYSQYLQLDAAASFRAAPWDRVDPTLASAERRASQSQELPPDLNSPLPLTGGFSQPRIIAKPEYQSNDISLEGNVSTQIIGSTLNIKADKLANNRSSGTSGTLRLTIWATLYQPSYGANISGYRLGYYQFSSTLQAGYYFGSIDQNVPYAGNPPDGTYYITMTAEEYSSSNNQNNDDGFGYRDLVVLNSTWTFGTSGGECVPDTWTACVLNNRFQVRLRVHNHFANPQYDFDASVKPVTGFASTQSETAFFYFTDANNIEMLVKLLNAGSSGIAVLYGVATPFELWLTITDTRSGAIQTYHTARDAQNGHTQFGAFPLAVPNNHADR